MKFYTLNQPVVQPGRTLIGFGKSQVTFHPAIKIAGFKPLSFLKNGSEVEIELSATSIRNRRMETKGLGHTIGAVEHYSPLRFLFPGIRISATNQEFPHFTCAGPLVNSLLEHASPAEINVPWYTVKGACVFQYPKARGGIEAFTMIEPSMERKLFIHVTVKFERFGEMSKSFVFPDETLLLKVLGTQSLGTPSWLEYPAKLLWPHAYETYWPKKDDADILETIINHRVQDILGALALLKSPIDGGFPSLNVYSQCSGHLADFNALNMVSTLPL